MRLLQDITARKVYELPDYEGPVEGDVLLEQLLERPDLKFEDGTDHVGNLMVIPDSLWERNRQRILAEIWRDFPDMGDDDIVKAYRNTYIEDANKCFNRHNRPKMGCIDFHDDSKRIGSPTKNRALAKLKPIYLCDFCPVASGYVATEIRYKKGLYD